MTQESIDAVSPVSGVGKKPLLHTNSKDAFSVKNFSYAMIVMEIINKVGLKHQQQIMQIRGKLMDVMTRMQNDFTTISEYISQIENNAHSGGAYASDNEHGDQVYGTNGFNGLDNTFYHLHASMCTSNGSDKGNWGKISSFSESPSQGFQTSTASFINAVKDLFYGNASSTSTGLTVGDISKITNPTGGPDFDFNGANNKFFNWKSLGSKFSAQFGVPTMIQSDPSAQPSLLQQYMFYKAQVDVYTMPRNKVKAANGDISLLENFDPQNTTLAPNQPSPDSLLQTFTQMLSAMNQPISVNRDGHWSVLSKSAPSLLKLITENKLNTTIVPGQSHYQSWHSGVKGPAGHDHHHTTYYNEGDPGLYLAVSMMAFDYFWTKNPNASTDEGVTNSTNDSSNNEGGGLPWASSKGAPKSDPLSNLYMTTNSVQTNISQQSSQGNNNFQSDVNVSSQLDNMTVNSIKSFFEGNSTMNRNSRIS